MKVFAHRGLSSKYPENTLEAFKRALEYKIDGIETDVQLTKDGECVIFHDEELDRTTNGKGFLKDYTLAELKKLNANNHYDGFYEIPTLDELLDLLAPHDITINLELKTSIFDFPGIEQKVYDKIVAHGVKDKVIISSFNHYTLLRFQAIDKSVRLGVLSGDRIIDAEDYVASHGFQCYHPMFVILDEKQVSRAHELGLAVNVWTVDYDFVYPILEKMGVDVMMTNKCDMFLEKK